MPNIPFPTEIPSLQDVRHEFDRLLDRVWHVGLSTAPLDGQDWAPCIDATEFADHFVVRVEVPGMSAEEVDVSILNCTLTVRGCKRAPAPLPEGARRLRAECRYGGFNRRYELPGQVQEDGISATCRDGVLEIRIPKAPEVRGRTVKVQSSP